MGEDMCSCGIHDWVDCRIACQKDLATPIKVASDGGKTSYYQLPEGATELNDLIEAKGMGFALGNIFKACYRMGEKDGADVLYDLNKIVFFAQERLIPYVKKHGRLP
jgi:hypothetical protein